MTMLTFDSKTIFFSFAIVNAHTNHPTGGHLAHSRSTSPRPAGIGIGIEHESDGNRSNGTQHHPNHSNTPNHSSHIVNSNISSQERTLYITFFCLTTTFLLCHLPRILLNIYEVPMSQDRELCRQVYKRPFYSPRWVLVRITFTFSIF